MVLFTSVKQNWLNTGHTSVQIWMTCLKSKNGDGKFDRSHFYPGGYFSECIDWLFYGTAGPDFHACIKKIDQVFSKVIRHGNTKELLAEQIVPGDLMVLEAGDMIPADGRIVQFNQLQCDESSLTGESFPVLKQLEAIGGSAELADRISMVFKGTAVMNGNAKVVVTGISEKHRVG